ncbi:hypothetical protein ACLB2K_033182 [Fragaria x ananassa]
MGGGERNEPQRPQLSVTDVVKETTSLFDLAFPMVITDLIRYSRSIISMLFLGRLGDSELSAGPLAIAYANITGYSVLSGLALGMEPLCSQAFGAGRPKLLSVTLHRCVLFLLLCSLLPISSLWFNISNILTYVVQDPKITSMAHTYLMFSLPDLFTNSLIHPIRIYLRAQGITHPVTLASFAGTCLHLPMNFLLVTKLQLGVAGVAAASAASNFLTLVVAVVYIWARGLHVPTWTAPSPECLTGWGPLLRLAGPSCVSVCLEWWWYCPQTVACGVLRGSARPSTAANVNLGAFYLVGMPVAVGLGLWIGFGFNGLWIGLLSAQICCAALLLCCGDHGLGFAGEEGAGAIVRRM